MLRSQAENQRRVKRGIAIGVALGGGVATQVLAGRAASKGSGKLAIAAGAAVVLANAGGVSARYLRKGRT